MLLILLLLWQSAICNSEWNLFCMLLFMCSFLPSWTNKAPYVGAGWVIGACGGGPRGAELASGCRVCRSRNLPVEWFKTKIKVLLSRVPLEMPQSRNWGRANGFGREGSRKGLKRSTPVAVWQSQGLSARWSLTDWSCFLHSRKTSLRGRDRGCRLSSMSSDQMII